MPTAKERLTHVALKVERAKEHLADLHRELAKFFESNPYKVATKCDPNTRKLIYYVSEVTPTPNRLALIAGDVLQNLMSALDHLAYQLVCSDTNDAPPNPGRIYFPIADDVAKYEASKGEKMQGASHETINAIDALKPYKGGNDLLWMLYRLNNIEKHRLLLTVGSCAAGVHLGQMFASSNKHLTGKERFPDWAMSFFESSNLYLNPADKGFPLKPGFELLIGAADEEPNPKQMFRFQIALSEAGIVEGKPLLETLNQLVTLVEGTVSALTPRLQSSP